MSIYLLVGVKSAVVDRREAVAKGVCSVWRHTAVNWDGCIYSDCLPNFFIKSGSDNRQVYSPEAE
jgi:hypothetical protein